MTRPEIPVNHEVVNPPMLTNWRLIFFICVVMVGTVAVGEVTAGMVYRTRPYTTSYDASRNPYYRRAWLEYTQPDVERVNDPNVQRIIVISNSQGFMREHPDAEAGLSYSAQLEQMLNEADPTTQYEVLNWSIGGGSSPEFTVLAARAGAHHPDIVILAPFTPNYVRRDVTDADSLSFFISDVYQLAYLPEVRQYLPERFLQAYPASSMTEFYEVYTNLGRIRHWFEDTDDSNWFPDYSVREETGQRNVYYIEWSETSTDLMRQFYETLSASAPDAQLLFVSMPLQRPFFDDESWGNMQAMGEAASELFADAPNVRVYDALNLIPPEEFYGPTHFNPEAHRQFALWLRDIILEQE
jgi:hypothetical protein